MSEPHLFDHVSDIVVSMAPEGLGEFRYRSHRRGVKVWFGPSKPPRVHYEAQVIPRRYVDGSDGLAIEIGFHAEEKDESTNQAALEVLLANRKVWAKELGREAEAGEFLGRDSWRRLSEVWLDPDLEDPELPFELASRLVDYLDLLEPIRQ